MTGPQGGLDLLTNAQAATPFSLCVLIFALFMIPGGKVQDKLGPKVGAITGGLFLALGCIVAGLTKSYSGLIVGFGLLGGIGMGLGYAAALPAALNGSAPINAAWQPVWLSAATAAGLYISPLAAYLLASGGITYSFVWLGIFFAVVVIIAGSLLAWPPAGYVAPAPPAKGRLPPPRLWAPRFTGPPAIWSRPGGSTPWSHVPLHHPVRSPGNHQRYQNNGPSR